jgi:hypothetical protein
MPPIEFLEALINASPSVAVFLIAVLALLVVWQALAVTARSLRRDRDDER